MSTTQLDINESAVAVTTSLAQIGNAIPLNGIGAEVTLNLQNTGSNATTHMSLYRQFVAGGPWLPWLGDTDFANPTGSMQESSITNSIVTPNLAPPNAMPAGSVAWFTVRTRPVVALAIYAQAGGATTLSINGAATLWPKRG